MVTALSGLNIEELFSIERLKSHGDVFTVYQIQISHVDLDQLELSNLPRREGLKGFNSGADRTVSR